METNGNSICDEIKTSRHLIMVYYMLMLLLTRGCRQTTTHINIPGTCAGISPAAGMCRRNTPSSNETPPAHLSTDPSSGSMTRLI